MKLPQRGIWIPVVTGLLKMNGKVLLGQRPLGNSLPGQWEFPGGKIELGETPEEALRRELQEELAIEAEIGKLRLAYTHSYKNRGILLLFFDVPFWKGEPKTAQHTELKWVDPNDLERMDIPEANRKILDRLMPVLVDR